MVDETQCLPPVSTVLFFFSSCFCQGGSLDISKRMSLHHLRGSIFTKDVSEGSSRWWFHFVLFSPRSLGFHDLI